MSDLLETHVVTTGPAPRYVVIWLHGLGADGFDFAPLVPELAQPDWPDLKFVFPHAPVRPITINNGYPMRAWYDIREMDLEQRADLEGVYGSVAQIDALIDAEIAAGFAPENVILAGFSQGGAIALTMALQSRHRLPHVIALSTYLPAPMATTEQYRNSGRKPVSKIFMAHGMIDPVVPMHAGMQSYQLLESVGFHVQWHAYAGLQHQLAPQEVTDLQRWLGTILTAG